MTNKGMFIRILAKSLKNRRTRIATAATAVLLGISLVTALAAISIDARGKVGLELRAYGANVLLSPNVTETRVGTGGLSFGAFAESAYLQEQSLDFLRAKEFTASVLGYVPYLYGVVDINQQKVVVAGISFDQIDKVSPWWRVTGRKLSDGENDSAMIGTNVAKKLGLEIGQDLTVRYGNEFSTLKIAGIVETGSAEDSQVFINLRVAQRLLEKPGLVSLVQISALTDRQPLSATVSDLRAKIPMAKVTIIGQVADAESSVVGRVELLMFIVSTLVLLASALTVSSTMMTAVLERTREIGLMKALGASESGVASIFLGEAAAIGFIGGILGFVVGALIANLAGQSVFGAAVIVNPLVLPLSVLVALAICLMASALPVREAVRIDPAVTLRGE